MATRHLLALALFATTPALAAQDAENPKLSVAVDHARVLKVTRPATTVIVGNPAIMDVTVQDSTTMVLTGRSYGVTNLIILDAQGEAIVDEPVSVTSNETATLRVYRQSSRETFSCTPECQPTVSIGDNSAAFETYADQYTRRQNLSIMATK